MIYYLIGIKGTGMSALAVTLLQQGHIVKGVDEDKVYFTERKLKDIPMDSFESSQLKKTYFYIIGNAYIHHEITEKIKKLHYKYLEYPKFISEHFKDYKFIGISGSHGKTTTTKMLVDLLPNCSYVIGDGTGCGLGKEAFIMESCEYRNTFLNYHPKIALILNIDYDHPDFFKTEEEYLKSFEGFGDNSKIVIVNGDDENIKKIKKAWYISYGVNENNDIVFNYELSGKYTKVLILGQMFMIPFIGIQYAYDFVGAYLIAKLMGKTDEEIAHNVQHLKLPKRRMEEKQIGGICYVHDYAHHPTEIKMVHDSICLKYPTKKIVCFFQPHTISRSEALYDKFKMALDLFDKVYILPTFASARESVNLEREKTIFEYWGYEKIEKNEIENIKKNSNKIYAFLGAGDIDKIYNEMK